MGKNRNEAQRKDTNGKIRVYQRLALYAAIPGIIDLATIIIALAASRRSFLLAFGLSRFLFGIFEANGVAFCAIFTSLAIASIYVLLAYFGVKGKPFAGPIELALYACDTGFLIYLLVRELSAGSAAPEMVLSLVAHGLFLILFALEIVFFILATKALKKEKQG